MSYIKFIITGLFAILFSNTAAAATKHEWLIFGETQGAVYELAMNTSRWIKEPFSVEIFVRTKFLKPEQIGKNLITHTVERTLVLCNEDMVIVQDQQQFMPTGKSITFNQAVIYLNTEHESVTSAMLKLLCGEKPESMKEPINPPAPKMIPKVIPGDSATARKTKIVV